ncbi:MAG: type II toxin-antitoxin system RelE/ParE family toxin [Planctomycetota bacterium]
MKLRWTERATNQLVAQLLDFPSSGSVVPEYGREDIREVFSDSYRIIHQVLPGEVRVLAVIHGSMTLPESPPTDGEIG